MNNNHHIDVATLKEMKRDRKWFSWTSPVGIIIFLNGMSTFGILLQYLIHN